MSKIVIYKAFHTYSEYLKSFYSKRSSLEYKSFNEQKSALVHDAFPWIFSWGEYNRDNDVEIFETVHNCEQLQKAWLGNNSKDDNWQLSIVFQQIKKIQPNICVLYPPQLFDEQKIKHIKSLVEHKLYIVGYDGMDRKNKSLYKEYDLVITCSEYISKFYRENDIEAYTLNFSFDSSILSKINKKTTTCYNVGFSGSLYPNVHLKRYELIKYLVRKLKLEIRSEYENNIDSGLFSKFQIKRLLKNKDINQYLNTWLIGKHNKGSVFGLEMYQFLSDSKISLNAHGDDIYFAANVRLYEITGVGSCLLTDWKENISEIFVPDKECITYNSKEEAFDKIKYLLKNENIRKKIAHAGQQRTLNEYTYEKCLPKLFDLLKNRLK
jgi:spore maturation protein CgeB